MRRIRHADLIAQAGDVWAVPITRHYRVKGYKQECATKAPWKGAQRKEHHIRSTMTLHTLPKDGCRSLRKSRRFAR
jgi:hypothetical protein